VSRVRVVRVLGALLLCAAAVGCVGKGASRDEQAASLARISDWTLDPRRYLEARTALLARPREDGHYAPAGTATAIARDGYFLTAAHVLDRGVPLLLRKDRRHWRLKLNLVPTRVVWSDPELDLAVIHAPLRLRRWLELTPEPGPRGEEVCSGGYVDGEVWVSLAAGELLEGHPAASEVPATRVDHSCPLRMGDSGGPLIDAQGRLLGINYEAHYHWLGFGGWTASACWIDPDWLQRLLSEDRAKRDAKGG